MTKLKTIFITILAITALIYLTGEFLDVDLGILSGTSETTLYVVQTVMVLVTLALIYLSLRLFKFKHIQNELCDRKEVALTFWGTVRLSLLGLILIGNTLLYYLFDQEPNFGHLAVISLLVMPFVYPSKRRCETEVTASEQQNENTETERA